MAENSRKSGIDSVGNVHWGTHLCQFYQTKEDLVDILIPYFKAGLETNEMCVWITSKLFKAEEAQAALEKAVDNFTDYVSKDQVKVLDEKLWYTKSGTFDGDEALLTMYKEENQALAKGFEGHRVAGDIFWPGKIDWSDLNNYDSSVHSAIKNRHIIAICNYRFDPLGPGEVLDVIRNHHLVLSKQQDKWEIIEKTGRTQTKIVENHNKKAKPNQTVMLTVSEAAEYLGLHINTVRRWSQTGMLKSYRLGTGRHRRFLREDLEHFLESPEHCNL
jgi:excisionase family DNA binding protein